MQPDPDDLDAVPLREIGDVLAEAALRAMGGPEFLASLAGVHMASSLTQAGFKVVRKAETHGRLADRRQPLLPGVPVAEEPKLRFGTAFRVNSLMSFV
jgi:hypothetical protein